MDDISRFVDYLIAENCEGCTECDPKSPKRDEDDCYCANQGRARWLMQKAEEFKAQIE